MRETQMDDIWLAWNDGYYIVIPTNGYVKNNGECVMGKELALQAKTKFPCLSLDLGEQIQKYGNVVFGLRRYRLFTFPVKHNWWEKANLDLIKKSCKELLTIVHYNFSDIPKPVYLPKVGCGNGKLEWKDVKSILEGILDDRFVVCIGD